MDSNYHNMGLKHPAREWVSNNKLMVFFMFAFNTNLE